MTATPKRRTATQARDVLIIEDRADARETLRAVLESWGHRVAVAVDGAEGLIQAFAFLPEVALIDIGLPKLDGYYVAERLRERFKDRIVLVACTAYGSADDRDRSFAAGFDAHLVKPVDLDQLAAWLDRARP